MRLKTCFSTGGRTGFVVVTVIVLAVFLAPGLPGQAVRPHRAEVGLKLGGTLAFFRGEDWTDAGGSLESYTTDHTFRFLSGLYGSYYTTRNWGVQGEVLYSQLGARYEFDTGSFDGSGTFKYQAVDATLMLKWRRFLRLNSVYFGLGPGVSLVFGDVEVRESADGFVFSAEVERDNDVIPIGGAIIGYTIDARTALLDVGLRYTIAVGSLWNDSQLDDIYQHALSFTGGVAAKW